MFQPGPGEVTRLLRRWRDGDEEAFERLAPLVYDELRRLARGQLRRERPQHTLQPTALVHEALIRLIGKDISWEDRVHFFAVASQSMRRILVDYARARKRTRRGGGAVHVGFDETRDAASDSMETVIELDAALRRLAQLDPRAASGLELHVFGGLTYEEAAAVLRVSRPTFQRDLRMAKAWLRRELERGCGPAETRP